MAEEQAGSEEEAQRVFDALDALEAMEDEGARARAISAVLREQQPRVKRLSDLRRAYVLKQRDAKVSVRNLAAELRVSPSTIQDIERGWTGSGKDRPRKGRNQHADAGEGDTRESAGGDAP
ncbi:helix-turn-helix domain-containing protein [Streptomyces sp. 2MCAF27]